MPPNPTVESQNTRKIMEQMRQRIEHLEVVSNEYNDLILHMSAGGDFDEFMKSRSQAEILATERLGDPLQTAVNAWTPTPEYFGFSEDVAFTVTRGGRAANKTASFADVVGFVEACGVDLNSGEVTLGAVLRGGSIEIDGAIMRFTVV